MRPADEAASVAPATTPAVAQNPIPAHPGIPAAPGHGTIASGSANAPPWTPFQRFSRAVVTGFLRTVAQVHVEGLEHIPTSGPVVIVANHVSMWDAPVLLCLARRRTVMFAAEELRHFPWLHWTLHHIWDAIYVRRGEGDTRALDQALEVLRSGAMLGLAPEGLRSSNGMRRGLTGAAHLSQRSGAPVLPVALFGQERIPVDARRFRRARVHVRIAPPIPPFEGEPTAEALRRWTDSLMTDIASQLPPAYRGVYAESVEDREPSTRNGA